MFVILIIETIQGGEHINDNNKWFLVLSKLPVEHGDNKLEVKVSGTGSAIMTIDLHYNRPSTEEESCPFSITDIDVQDVEDLQIDQGLANER